MPSPRVASQRRRRFETPIGPNPAATAAPASPTRLWLLFGLVLGLAAIFAWREETSLDLGFHIASGRWILEHHQWPRLDPLTYTVPDHPYIDMHGLFQVACALAWNVAGAMGIACLRVAFALSTIVLLWLNARRRGADSPAVLAAVFALGVCALELRLDMRPELVTALFLALELYVLNRHAESGEARWLYATVPLQLVWVWSHALSLFGVAVLGLYALSSAATSLVARRRLRYEPWVAFALGAAVMLANPYGIRGITFLWYLRTRVEAGNIYAETINELKSPLGYALHGYLPVLSFGILFLLTAALVLTRPRAQRLFDVLVLVLFGALAATRVRAIGMFVVAALPIAAAGACDVARRVREAGSLGARRAATAVVTFAIVGVAVMVVSGAWYAANHRAIRFGCRESPAVYPIGNVLRFQALGLRGPLLNIMGFGGYVELHLWPRERAFVDARLEVIGDQFYLDCIRLQNGNDWAESSRRYGWNAALVSYTTPGLQEAVASDSAWALIGVDGVSTLFARKAAVNAASIDSCQAELRRENAACAPSAERLVPAPLRPRLLRWDVPRTAVLEASGRGSALARLGLLHAARREFARALEEGGANERAVVSDYALTNVLLGRKAEALEWYQRLQQLDPGNLDAASALDHLRR